MNARGDDGFPGGQDAQRGLAAQAGPGVNGLSAPGLMDTAGPCLYARYEIDLDIGGTLEMDRRDFSERFVAKQH